jgi:hypothetical protein
MKKSIVFIIIIAFFLCRANAQERVNRENLSFDKESGILLSATGWAYNSTLGEWIDYTNVISSNKDYKENIFMPKGKDMMSRNSRNFINIQFKSLVFKGERYFVLIIQKWEGYYKYEAIKEDWIRYKKTYGYIYNKNEYSKIHTIKDSIGLTTKYIVSMGFFLSRYKEKEFLDLIQSELCEKKTEYHTEYVFPVIKSKEGMIRFHLPRVNSSYSSIDFSTSYFEVSPEEFSVLIIK